MEELLANRGLNLIAKKILSFSCAKSIASCRQVCHLWKDLVDNDRKWLILQLEHIQSTISVTFPEWQIVSTQCSKQNIPRLREFVNHMWIYLKDFKTCHPKTMPNVGVESDFHSKDYKKRHQNPLHDAIIKSNYGFIQLLIDCGIDLTMKDSEEWTSMHYVCLVGRIEMVQLLIKNSPSFDAASTTKQNNTIFHFAVQNSDPQVIEVILDNFKLEDPAAGTRDGWKMIHHAVEFGKKETIEFLLNSEQKYGFSTEERALKGETMLHVACWMRDIEIIDLISKAFQKRKSDINFDTRDYCEHTCLHYTCANRNLDVPTLLLKRFPQKVNLLCSEGRHFLHLASQTGCLEMIKYMHTLENPDFDFNVECDQGYRPLFYACAYGKREVIKYFFDNFVSLKIDIFNQWDEGKAIAQEMGHQNISNMFSDWNYVKLSRRALYVARKK